MRAHESDMLDRTHKRYFKLVYFLVLVSVSFAMSYYLRGIYDVESSEDLFRLDSDIHTLIIGDSHMMSSLNPDIIDGSKNIAQDSENYFFTYYKLKRYLSRNTQIRSVILGFATNNVALMGGDFIFHHEPTENQVLERYYRLLDLKGKLTIMSSRKYFVWSVLKYELGIPWRIYSDDFLVKKLLRRKVTESDYTFVGGFYRSEKSNVNDEDTRKKIKDYYYNDDMTYQGRSDFNIEYLKKIIDLCAMEGIKVYLYNSPVYPAFKEMIPDESLRDFEEVKNEIIERYNAVVYIDHSDYIHDKAYFGDQDHVNSYGASVVSRIFNDEIIRTND